MKLSHYVDDSDGSIPHLLKLGVIVELIDDLPLVYSAVESVPPSRCTVESDPLSVLFNSLRMAVTAYVTEITPPYGRMSQTL